MPSTADLVLILTVVMGVPVAIASVAAIVLGITAYKIAQLVATPEPRPRPVPPIGRRRDPGFNLDSDTPVAQGINRWPRRRQAQEAADLEDEDVAQDEGVQHFVGAAEGAIQSDRESWWNEQREAGYTDDEIAEMEASRVVPVFGGDS